MVPPCSSPPPPATAPWPHAALSCANSGLYGTIRALYSLSREGLAPAWLSGLNRNGVPARATLLITLLTAGNLALTFVLQAAMAAFFGARGFTVLTAEGTDAALAVLEGEVPDMIFIVDVATKKLVKVDSSNQMKNDEFVWEMDDYTWSPDSKWIAYLQFDVGREPVYPQAALTGRRARFEPERVDGAIPAHAAATPHGSFDRQAPQFGEPASLHQ